MLAGYFFGFKESILLRQAGCRTKCAESFVVLSVRVRLLLKRMLCKKPFKGLMSVGLVMFRGGAAGAAATKRRRQESFLVDGLKKLLSSLNDFNDDNESPQHRGRPSVRQETTYRDVSPASSLSNRSRSPSPEWQVKGKKKPPKGSEG